MVCLSAAAIGIVVAAFGTPAFAQSNAESGAGDQPQATTATYRDWTLRCDMLSDPDPRRVCEIVQAVRAPDSQSVLAQIVIGRPGPDAPLKLIVQLPAGVWLPAAVGVAAPSGDSIEAAFTRCMQLCVADADIDDAMVEALRTASEPATLTFQDGNRRSIELPISLDGFTAAIAEAQK